MRNTSFNKHNKHKKPPFSHIKPYYKAQRTLFLSHSSHLFQNAFVVIFRIFNRK